MTLSFRTQFKDGTPTNFVGKIWSGIAKYNLCHPAKRFDYGMGNHRGWIGLPPKIHTIRADKSDRWKSDNKIHFVINNRTPDRFQFAPIINCISVEDIFITYPGYGDMLKITVGDNYLYYPEQLELAINDGFETYEDFFDWFHPICGDYGFRGKIIHWTPLTYGN